MTLLITKFRGLIDWVLKLGFKESMRQSQAFKLTKNLSEKNSTNHYLALSLVYEITRVVNTILGCNRVWSTYTVYANKSINNFHEYLQTLSQKLKERFFKTEILKQEDNVALLSITFMPPYLITSLELELLKALNSIYGRCPSGKYFGYHTIYREPNMGPDEFYEHVKAVATLLKDKEYVVKIEKQETTYACLLIKWDHPFYILPYGV